jgi:hypothetical protein
MVVGIAGCRVNVPETVIDDLDEAGIVSYFGVPFTVE